MKQWHKYDPADIAIEFGTDINHGRSSEQRKSKRKGGNKAFVLPGADAKTIIKSMSADASFILLVVAYIISAFLGRLHESIAGIAFVLLSFFVSFSIKYRSSKRISNSYMMLLPAIKVIENGSASRLSIFDVEPGDLITLSQGDIVPAEARIVYSNSLIVAERLFNGDSGRIEYRRVEKTHVAISENADPLSIYDNMLSPGSMVVSGKGRAIVTSVLNDTEPINSHAQIRVVKNDDIPGYLKSFFSAAKKVSMFSFLAVAPITLAFLAFRSLGNVIYQELDLLYFFLLILSLSVTCMGEISIAPAESLITKELLISSRRNLAKNNTESRITKYSSAETLADIDTVLILTPDVLLDNQITLRRVFFADKQFRFDALDSDTLNDFYSIIYPIFKYTHENNMSADLRIISDYIANHNKISYLTNNDSTQNRDGFPKFIRNYPLNGIRSCVFGVDKEGKPQKFISHSSDISLLSKCSRFRTEGGGVWQLDNSNIAHIENFYDEYVENGLKVISFVSFDSHENEYIFEGMIAIGSEFAFANGDLQEELSVSGIQPIIVLNKENAQNIRFVLQCGLISEMSQVALASEYQKNGLSVTDAPLSTRAYIGFDGESLMSICERLRRNDKTVLPIIKDSGDRKSVSPINVYATHATESHDSVKIASSLSLKPADAIKHDGGVCDALKIIRGSSMARLKLGIYKNYLAFTMLLRVVSVSLALLSANFDLLLSTTMILVSGLLCDILALLSISCSKGVPVKPRNTAADTKILLSPALMISFAFAGVTAAISIWVLSKILLNVGILSALSAPLFVMYSIISMEISALGGFLLMLFMRSRRRSFNYCYTIVFAYLLSILFIQSKLPESVYNYLNQLGIYRIELRLLPYIAIVSIVSFLMVILIAKLLTTFTSSKKIG